jgi:Transmembrane secretion effector
VLVSIASKTIHTASPFYVAAFAFGLLRAFNAPAIRSLTPAAAPKEMLPRVSALGAVSWQFGVIGAPILGAFAYEVSPRTAYLVAVALLLVTLVSAHAIPAALGTAHRVGGLVPRGSFRDAFTGLRVMRANPILLGAISLDLFAVLFGGATALLPALVKDILQRDSGDVGLLRAVGGAGAAAVAVLLAIRPIGRHVGRWLLLAVGAFGLATIVLGFSRSVPLSAIALLVLSGADAVSVFIRSTLVPLVTPAAERGRVLAVEAVFIGASNELGAFESGELAHHVGTVTSIVFGGVATVVVCLVWWFAFAPLRDTDRFTDLV